MIAAVINALLVFLGSALGLIFKSRIREKYSNAVIKGLGLCVAIIGARSALQTQNILCVIICMVAGLLLGELLRIEDRLDGLGNSLKGKIAGRSANSKFTEGFVTATLLFCVGSMAIIGSMEAGINQDYSTILSKSVIDSITAVTLAATMGIGVFFSGFAVLIYQGLLTLLAIWAGPFLPDKIITEMSAVGGLLIMGLAINMLGLLGDKKIQVGNMLPAIFLPIAYIPLVDWLQVLAQ
jgi:uncharacterized membrane protein YqgA involved in biofilm formation